MNQMYNSNNDISIRLQEYFKNDFNDEIPSEEDFIKTISDYLTFEFSMVIQGRESIFQEAPHDPSKE